MGQVAQLVRYTHEDRELALVERTVGEVFAVIKVLAACKSHSRFNGQVVRCAYED